MRRWTNLLLVALLFGVVPAARGASLPEDMLRPSSSGSRSLQVTDADMAMVVEDESAVSWNQGDGFSPAPRRWWPIVLSAAVPGLGEVSTGHLRGYPMIAADLGLWLAAKKKHDDGNDRQDEFEAFALEHWSEDEWRLALANADLNNMDAFFPEYELGSGSTPADVPLYVSRAADEREWFENLGKWDVFAWGWREYWDEEWNDQYNNDLIGYGGYIPSPTDPSENFFPDNPTMTPLRKDYIDMRQASDDAFVARDRFMSASLLLRVLSVFQMTYLEGFVGGRYGATASAGDPPTARFFATPGVRDAARVGWKVSF